MNPHVLCGINAEYMGIHCGAVWPADDEASCGGVSRRVVRRAMHMSWWHAHKSGTKERTEQLSKPYKLGVAEAAAAAPPAGNKPHFWHIGKMCKGADPAPSYAGTMSCSDGSAFSLQDDWAGTSEPHTAYAPLAAALMAGTQQKYSHGSLALRGHGTVAEQVAALPQEADPHHRHPAVHWHHLKAQWSQAVKGIEPCEEDLEMPQDYRLHLSSQRVLEDRKPGEVFEMEL
eukprot:TRINITY_DN3800_c0_g1_i1.p1 TRINITY_DN3800_c0_g1~~TRINITY_DN3800_c0_g1_i1.p1  ORF type:complete len:230 (+),score=39.09 TRINITY_DN3800_c0_g1_i1:2-691(+)